MKKVFFLAAMFTAAVSVCAETNQNKGDTVGNVVQYDDGTLGVASRRVVKTLPVFVSPMARKYDGVWQQVVADRSKAIPVETHKATQPHHFQLITETIADWEVAYDPDAPVVEVIPVNKVIKTETGLNPFFPLGGTVIILIVVAMIMRQRRPERAVLDYWVAIAAAFTAAAAFFAFFAFTDAPPLVMVAVIAGGTIAVPLAVPIVDRSTRLFYRLAVGACSCMLIAGAIMYFT